jgi:hypothetical protein
MPRISALISEAANAAATSTERSSLATSTDALKTISLPPNFPKSFASSLSLHLPAEFQASGLMLFLGLCVTGTGGKTPMPIIAPAQLPRWVTPSHPTVIPPQKQKSIAVSNFGQRGFTARSVKRRMRSHPGDPSRHAMHWVGMHPTTGMFQVPTNSKTRAEKLLYPPHVS